MAQYAKYFVDIVRSWAKNLVERDGLHVNDPVTYKVLVDELFSQNGSSLLMDLLGFMDRNTQGRWQQQNAISESELNAVIDAWLRNAVPFIRGEIAKASGRQSQPIGMGMPGGFGYTPPQIVNPTAMMYDSPQRPTSRATSQFGDTLVNDFTSQAEDTSDYELPRQVNLELRKATNAELQATQGGIVEVSNYYTGEHDRTRILTAEISLRVPQNSGHEAARDVFQTAPQEVIRGTHVNIIRYEELFHIPMGYTTFSTLADEVWTAFSKDNGGWREANKVLGTRPRGEWNVLDKSLCQLLNPAMARRIRSSQISIPPIIGISSIDDLASMDDRNANYPVARHPNYWSTFDSVVTSVFKHMFNPKNRIGPEDVHFGDFVHCDDVLFYDNGHSKYDYGVFSERVDRQEFINRMLAENTVVRIPSSVLMTNAIDPRLIARVKKGDQWSQIILHTVNTVGTAMLNKIEYLKRFEVGSVICLEKTGFQPIGQIRIGRTLEEDVVLLP